MERIATFPQALSAVDTHPNFAFISHMAAHSLGADKYQHSTLSDEEHTATDYERYFSVLDCKEDVEAELEADSAERLGTAFHRQARSQKHAFADFFNVLRDFRHEVLTAHFREDLFQLRSKAVFLEKLTFEDLRVFFEGMPGSQPRSWPHKLDEFLQALFRVPVTGFFHQPFKIQGQFYREFEAVFEGQLAPFRAATASDTDLANLGKMLTADLVVNFLRGSFRRLLRSFGRLNAVAPLLTEAQSETVSPGLAKTLAVLFKSVLLAVKKTTIDFRGHVNRPERVFLVPQFKMFDFSLADGYSCTTDGAFLYEAIASPHLIHLAKIGTGRHGTRPGILYKEVVVNAPSQKHLSLVFLKGRLYLKHSTDQVGNVDVLSPADLSPVGSLHLNVAKYLKNPHLAQYNKSFRLFSDGNALFALFIGLSSVKIEKAPPKPRDSKAKEPDKNPNPGKASEDAGPKEKDKEKDKEKEKEKEKDKEKEEAREPNFFSRQVRGKFGAPEESPNDPRPGDPARTSGLLHEMFRAQEALRNPSSSSSFFAPFSLEDRPQMSRARQAKFFSGRPPPPPDVAQAAPSKPTEPETPPASLTKIIGDKIEEVKAQKAQILKFLSGQDGRLMEDPGLPPTPPTAPIEEEDGPSSLVTPEAPTKRPGNDIFRANFRLIDRLESAEGPGEDMDRIRLKRSGFHGFLGPRNLRELDEGRPAFRREPQLGKEPSARVADAIDRMAQLMELERGGVRHSRPPVEADLDADLIPTERDLRPHRGGPAVRNLGGHWVSSDMGGYMFDYDPWVEEAYPEVYFNPTDPQGIDALVQFEMLKRSQELYRSKARRPPAPDRPGTSTKGPGNPPAEGERYLVDFFVVQFNVDQQEDAARPDAGDNPKRDELAAELHDKFSGFFDMETCRAAVERAGMAIQEAGRLLLKEGARKEELPTFGPTSETLIYQAEATGYDFKQTKVVKPFSVANRSLLVPGDVHGVNFFVSKHLLLKSSGLLFSLDPADEVRVEPTELENGEVFSPVNRFFRAADRPLFTFTASTENIDVLPSRPGQGGSGGPGGPAEPALAGPTGPAKEDSKRGETTLRVRTTFITSHTALPLFANNCNTLLFHDVYSSLFYTCHFDTLADAGSGFLRQRFSYFADNRFENQHLSGLCKGTPPDETETQAILSSLGRIKSLPQLGQALLQILLCVNMTRAEMPRRLNDWVYLLSLEARASAGDKGKKSKANFAAKIKKIADLSKRHRRGDLVLSKSMVKVGWGAHFRELNFVHFLCAKGDLATARVLFGLLFGRPVAAHVRSFALATLNVVASYLEVAVTATELVEFTEFLVRSLRGTASEPPDLELLAVVARFGPLLALHQLPFLSLFTFALRDCKPLFHLLLREFFGTDPHVVNRYPTRTSILLACNEDFGVDEKADRVLPFSMAFLLRKQLAKVSHDGSVFTGLFMEVVAEFGNTAPDLRPMLLAGIHQILCACYGRLAAKAAQKDSGFPMKRKASMDTPSTPPKVTEGKKKEWVSPEEAASQPAASPEARHAAAFDRFRESALVFLADFLPALSGQPSDDPVTGQPLRSLRSDFAHLAFSFRPRDLALRSRILQALLTLVGDRIAAKGGTLRLRDSGFEALESRVHNEGLLQSEVHVLETSHPIERGKNVVFKRIRNERAIGFVVEFDRRCQNEETSDSLVFSSWFDPEKKTGQSQSGEGNVNRFLSVSARRSLRRLAVFVGNNLDVHFISSNIAKNNLKSLNQWGYKLYVRPIIGRGLDFQAWDASGSLARDPEALEVLVEEVGVLRMALFAAKSLTEGLLRGTPISHAERTYASFLNWGLLHKGLANLDPSRFLVQGADQEFSLNLPSADRQKSLLLASAESEVLSLTSKTGNDRVSFVTEDGELQELLRSSADQDSDVAALIQQVRALAPMPFAYASEKKRVSFEKEAQTAWDEVETLVVLAYLHHARILDLLKSDWPVELAVLLSQPNIKAELTLISKKRFEVVSFLLAETKSEQLFQGLFHEVFDLLVQEYSARFIGPKLEAQRGQQSLQADPPKPVEVLDPKEALRRKCVERQRKRQAKPALPVPKKPKEKAPSAVESRRETPEPENFNFFDLGEAETLLKDPKWTDQARTLATEFLEGKTEELPKLFLKKDIEITKEPKENIRVLVEFVLRETRSLLTASAVKGRAPLILRLENPYRKAADMMRARVVFLLRINASLTEKLAQPVELGQLALRKERSIRQDRLGKSSDSDRDLQPLGAVRAITSESGRPKRSLESNSLRDWMDFYKNWREQTSSKADDLASPDCSPIHSVTKFLSIAQPLRMELFQSIILSASRRIALRTVGFQHFKRLVGTVEGTVFELVPSPFLAGLFPSLSVFENVQTTGQTLKGILSSMALDVARALSGQFLGQLDALKRVDVQRIFALKKQVAAAPAANPPAFFEQAQATLGQAFSLLQEVFVLLNNAAFEQSVRNSLASEGLTRDKRVKFVAQLVPGLLQFLLFCSSLKGLSFDFRHFAASLRRTVRLLSLLLGLFTRTLGHSFFLADVLAGLLRAELGETGRPNAFSLNLFHRIADPVGEQRLLCLLKNILKVLRRFHRSDKREVKENEVLARRLADGLLLLLLHTRHSRLGVLSLLSLEILDSDFGVLRHFAKEDLYTQLTFTETVCGRVSKKDFASRGLTLGSPKTQSLLDKATQRPHTFQPQIPGQASHNLLNVLYKMGDLVLPAQPAGEAAQPQDAYQIFLHMVNEEDLCPLVRVFFYWETLYPTHSRRLPKNFAEYTEMARKAGGKPEAEAGLKKSAKTLDMSLQFFQQMTPHMRLAENLVQEIPDFNVLGGDLPLGWYFNSTGVFRDMKLAAPGRQTLYQKTSRKIWENRNLTKLLYTLVDCLKMMKPPVFVTSTPEDEATRKPSFEIPLTRAVSLGSMDLNLLFEGTDSQAPLQPVSLKPSSVAPKPPDGEAVGPVEGAEPAPAAPAQPEGNAPPPQEPVQVPAPEPAPAEPAKRAEVAVPVGLTEEQMVDRIVKAQLNLENLQILEKTERPSLERRNIEDGNAPPDSSEDGPRVSEALMTTKIFRTKILELEETVAAYTRALESLAASKPGGSGDTDRKSQIESKLKGLRQLMSKLETERPQPQTGKIYKNVSPEEQERLQEEFVGGYRLLLTLIEVCKSIQTMATYLNYTGYSNVILGAGVIEDRRAKVEELAYLINMLQHRKMREVSLKPIADEVLTKKLAPVMKPVNDNSFTLDLSVSVMEARVAPRLSKFVKYAIRLKVPSEDFPKFANKFMVVSEHAPTSRSQTLLLNALADFVNGLAAREKKTKEALTRLFLRFFEGEALSPDPAQDERLKIGLLCLTREWRGDLSASQNVTAASGDQRFKLIAPPSTTGRAQLLAVNEQEPKGLLRLAGETALGSPQSKFDLAVLDFDAKKVVERLIAMLKDTSGCRSDVPATDQASPGSRSGPGSVLVSGSGSGSGSGSRSALAQQIQTALTFSLVLRLLETDRSLSTAELRELLNMPAPHSVGDLESLSREFSVAVERVCDNSRSTPILAFEHYKARAQRYPFELERRKVSTNTQDVLNTRQGLTAPNAYDAPKSTLLGNLDVRNERVSEFKMLKYWEKHIIPKIFGFVKGSLAQYEIEDFFEQIRIELRKENNAGASNIAYILCDQKLPGDCVLPQLSYDWNCPDLEEVKIGQFVSVRIRDERGLHAQVFDRHHNLGLSHALGTVVFRDPVNNCVNVLVRDYFQTNLYSVWVPQQAVRPLEVRLAPPPQFYPAEELLATAQDKFDQFIKSLKSEFFFKELVKKDYSLVPADLPMLQLVAKRELTGNCLSEWLDAGWGSPVHPNRPQVLETLLAKVAQQGLTGLILDRVEAEASTLLTFCARNNYSFNMTSKLDVTVDTTERAAWGPSRNADLNIFDCPEEVAGLVVEFKSSAQLFKCSGVKFFLDAEGIDLAEHVHATQKSELTTLYPLVFNSAHVFYHFYYNAEALPAYLKNQSSSSLDCTVFAVPAALNFTFWIVDALSAQAASGRTAPVLARAFRIASDLFANFHGSNVVRQSIFKLMTRVIVRLRSLLADPRCQDREVLAQAVIDRPLDVPSLVTFLEHFTAAAQGELCSSFVQDLTELLVLYSSMGPLVESLAPKGKAPSFVLGHKTLVEVKKLFALADFLARNGRTEGAALVTDKERREVWEILHEKLDASLYFNHVILVRNIPPLGHDLLHRLILEVAAQERMKLLVPNLDVYIPRDAEDNSVGYAVILYDSWELRDDTPRDPKQEEKDEAPPVARMWQCDVCTLLNEDSATVCCACESPKPEHPTYPNEEKEPTKPAEPEEASPWSNEVKADKFRDELLKAFERVTPDKRISVRRLDRGSPGEWESNEVAEFLMHRMIADEFQAKLPAVCGQLWDSFQESLAEDFEVDSAEGLRETLLGLEPVRFFRQLAIYGVDFWLEKSCMDSKNTEQLTLLPRKDLERLLEFAMQDVCDDGHFGVHFSGMDFRVEWKTPLRNLDIFAADAAERLFFKESRQLFFKQMKLNAFSNFQLRLSLAALHAFNQLLVRHFKYIDVARATAEPSQEFLSLGALVSGIRHLWLPVVKNRVCDEVLQFTACARDHTPKVSFERLTKEKEIITERRADARRPPKKEVEDRSFSFIQAFKQLADVPASLLRPHKPKGTEPFISFEIVFKGEHVMGEGGPYRQFYSDISAELQPLFGEAGDAKALNLFIASPNRLNDIGDAREKFVVNPSKRSSYYLQLYEFVGVLMGCAFRTGVFLSVNLPGLFWKKLVGEAAGEEDLEEVDKGVVELVKFFRGCSAEDLEENIFQTFTVLLSDASSVDLLPDGKDTKVTALNKDLFVQKVLEARLREADPQTAAVRSGFTKIVPEVLLNCLTARDLETRVCGRTTIDFALLKRHTRYSGGLTEDSLLIRNFWKAISSFSVADKQRFVKFCWGQERLPATSQEFENAHIRFMVKPSMYAGSQDGLLPRADTCFFNFELPNYSSFEILKEKILLAIHTDCDSMNAEEVQSEHNQHRDDKSWVTHSQDSHDYIEYND